MAGPQTTLLEETRSAARGIVAVIMGDRQAPGYFDFSQRGLVGSFVAFLVASLVNALAPRLLGIELPPGAMTRGLVLVGVLYAAQIGFSALVLRQLGRLDGLIPYLVASNWATFFASLLTSLLLGVGDIVTLVLLGVGLLVQVNIARLIVTLSASQIVIFLVAQVVGLTLALMALFIIAPGLFLPGPDAAAAAGLVQ